MEGKGCQQTNLCQAAGLWVPTVFHPPPHLCFPTSPSVPTKGKFPEGIASCSCQSEGKPRADILSSSLKRKTQRYWLPLLSSCTSSCSTAAKTSHCPKTRHFTSAAPTVHGEFGQQGALHQADTLSHLGKLPRDSQQRRKTSIKTFSLHP